MDGLAVIEGGAMHHFVDCGLDYVWLVNGFEVRDAPFGRLVRVHDIDGLHAAIARWIVCNPSRMRGQEVRFLRSMLGLSQDGLAKALGRTRVSVARWEQGRDRPVLASADRALRMLYALKAMGDNSACRLVDVLVELDELENGHEGQSQARFDEAENGWRAAA